MRVKDRKQGVFPKSVLIPVEPEILPSPKKDEEYGDMNSFRVNAANY